MKKYQALLMRIKQALPVIVILVIGAYLRLYKISEYMTFLGDEGRDVLVVRRMIVEGKWTLLGPTASVGGFFMGPIYYYMMMPFLWAWHLNPVGPAIMVALVGICTIWLVYYVGKRWFTKPIGLLSALLYAISPVVISYSRSSWNPNIVPFFSLLLAYILWNCSVTSKWNRLFFIGLLMGIGLQLHYTFLFLAVFTFVWLLIEKNYLSHIKHYMLGIVGFLVGFSPFLAFEVRHEFANTRSILDFIFKGKDTGFAASHFIGNVADVFVRLFGRLLLRIPDPGVLGNLPYGVKTVWSYGEITFALLALISFVILLVHKKALQAVLCKGQPVQKYNIWSLKILGLWLVVPLCMFGLYKKNIYDYYFGIFFAIPFFMTAISIVSIATIKKIGPWIAGCITIILVVLNWTGRPFVFEPNNQLRQMETIARTVIEKTDGKPYNFALVTAGNSDHAYRYFFELWEKPPTTIENADVDPERKTVTNQLLVVCEETSCQPIGNSLWEIAGFGQAEIDGVWDVPFVKIYKLRHYIEGNY